MTSVRLCLSSRPSSMAICWKTLSMFSILAHLLHKVTIVMPSGAAHNKPLLAIPGLDPRTYEQLGDVNIGVFLVTGEMGPINNPCLPPAKGSSTIEITESVAYAVNEVNRNQSLLPNVTLGFVILNDCGDERIALAQALSFLPRAPGPYHNYSSSQALTDEDVSVPEEGSQAVMPYYDVVAVVSPMTSSSAVAVSQLLGTAHIPQVVATASSDDLSDKTRHPYLVRTISPDIYAIRAMLSFVANNGWSYVSVIYEYGAYGENAFDNIKTMSPDYGICIATSHRVDRSTNFSGVVQDLLTYPRARVVILYAYPSGLAALFDAVLKCNNSGHFVWIGGEVFTSRIISRFADYKEVIAGSFIFRYYKKPIPAVNDYIGRQKVNSTKNPWFVAMWEILAGCSVTDPDCDLSQKIMKSFSVTMLSSKLVDSILAIAHAVHHLRAAECPDSSGPEVRQCITRPQLLSYLKNVSFQGSTGQIEFDKNGDVLGQYEIKQLILNDQNSSTADQSSSLPMVEQMIALYDTKSQRLDYTENSIAWRYFLQKDRVVPLHLAGDTDPVRPESVCSRPCLVGEYKIQKELECCWECRQCRENEKLVKGNTGCQVCPALTWPDPETGLTSCESIPLTYPHISQTLPLIKTCISVLACLGVTLVAAGYWYFRHHRVIKAASKELSCVQIVAMYVGYLTVIVFQLTPTDASCSSVYFMFTLSFTSLYAPMIVKALRVYRIFVASALENRKLRFVSPNTQLVMAALLILVQFVQCVICYVLFPPTAKTTQLVLTEKYVELSCDLTLPGLGSFLTYNLVLISISLAMAFKTRKLPDNFNESWFIFMCATTTLVIWLAFIPTYFTASRQFVQALLLSLALILNHTVAMVFLFFPKLYAAFCVSPESVAATNFLRDTAMSSAAPTTFHIQSRPARVMPLEGRAGCAESSRTSTKISCA